VLAENATLFPYTTLFRSFYGLLDEQQRRLFAGIESLRLGHGGDKLLAEFLGLDVHTVARGREQLLEQEVSLGRIRRIGGGRSRRSEEHTSELQSRGHLVC